MTPATMGVDPGVRGGVAVIAGEGHAVFTAAFAPDMTRTQLKLVMRAAVKMLRGYHGAAAWLEKVGYMPGDGGQGAFTFGRVCGLLEGLLAEQDVDLRDVYPQTWQAALECLSGGNKNVTKNRAAALFPYVKVTHGIADALLIAEFGRRRLTARLP